MEKRALSLLSLLLFVFLAAGCSMFDSKPEAAPVMTSTRWFLGESVKYELQGTSSEALMGRAEVLQKRVSLKRDEQPGDQEMAIYRLYVKADTNQDQVITDQEAEAFFKWYQMQFNAHVGSIKF